MHYAKESHASSRLAKCLVAHHLLEEPVAAGALREAEQQQLSLVTYLVQNNLLTSLSIASCLAREFGLPLLDLNEFQLKYVPMAIATHNQLLEQSVLPLYVYENQLYLAMADPSPQLLLDKVRFKTGMRLHLVIVEEAKLTKVIKKLLEQNTAGIFKTLEAEDHAQQQALAPLSREEEENTASEAPIVRLVHAILVEAVNKRASDIHFEPYENCFRVRFRVDGVLNVYSTIPCGLAPRIISRLKVLAQLDISERRLPQDGRFKLNVDQSGAVDFRINTCPTLFGEKAVLRVLDVTQTKIAIDALGLEEFQKNLFVEAIHKPYGMVLVTGPTGSGKTASLYSALTLLNSPDRNILTVEDPVEINIYGLNQVNVNSKIGLDFATVLRAFLRQDPDTIMLGEIRDVETAEIAIKAAQTGHLVLSTLHTHSALGALARLKNMGIPSYNIAGSIHLIMAQRLIRKLCPNCKQAKEMPTKLLLESGFLEEELGQLKLYEPRGCENCSDGFRGQTGIYELLPMTEEIQAQIVADLTSHEIGRVAFKHGVQRLRQSALHKVRQGITCLSEINRVSEE